jgi:hypothetical protein
MLMMHSQDARVDNGSPGKTGFVEVVVDRGGGEDACCLNLVGQFGCCIELEREDVSIDVNQLYLSMAVGERTRSSKR